MSQLLIAEFLKLRKRQLSWILIAIAAIFTGFIYAIFLLVVVQGEATVENSAGLTDLEDMTALRNTHIFGFGIIHQTMAVVAVILTALAITGEFSWRTLITMMTWTGDRVRFLVAKLIVLCGFIAVGTILCWFVAAMGSTGIEVINGTLSSEGLNASWAGDVIASYGRTTLAIIIYAMSAAAIAAVTRSTAIAIGLTLVLLYVEPLAVQLLTLFPGDIDRLDVLLISTNVNGLLQANGTVENMQTMTGDLPSAIQSALYVSVVSVASAAIAVLAVARRDVDL